MNDNDYIHIESWMGNRLGLRGNLLLCFALIHGYSRYGNGLFKGTLKYLADAIFCSEPTVISCLDKLIELELIRKQKINIKGHERCVYMVCVTFKDGELVCIDDTKDSLVGHTKDSLVYNKYIEGNIKDNKKRLSNDNQKENLDFDSFYKLYPRKRSRLTAEKAWKKLSVKDRKEAIEKIPVYIADCAECKREVKYPATYLNQRTWEDDFTNDGKLSKEEQTEESGIVYPDGMTGKQWMDITAWLQNYCRHIAGYITPEMLTEMKALAGDSKTLSDILKELGEASEHNRNLDIMEEFKKRIKERQA